MDYFSIIAAAAKGAGISAHLLYAICSYESANFTDTHVANDGGSASVGICMIKIDTARMFGFKGTLFELEHNHRVNSKYAAKYLAYHKKRYGNNWLMITAAYNAGKYNPSQKVKGCPMNLKYVSRVKKRLKKGLQSRLSCGMI